MSTVDYRSKLVLNIYYGIFFVLALSLNLIVVIFCYTGACSKLHHIRPYLHTNAILQVLMALTAAVMQARLVPSEDYLFLISYGLEQLLPQIIYSSSYNLFQGLTAAIALNILGCMYFRLTIFQGKNFKYRVVEAICISIGPIIFVLLHFGEKQNNANTLDHIYNRTFLYTEVYTDIIVYKTEEVFYSDGRKPREESQLFIPIFGYHTMVFRMLESDRKAQFSLNDILIAMALVLTTAVICPVAALFVIRQIGITIIGNSSTVSIKTRKSVTKMNRMLYIQSILLFAANGFCALWFLLASMKIIPPIPTLEFLALIFPSSLAVIDPLVSILLLSPFRKSLIAIFIRRKLSVTTVVVNSSKI